MPVCFHRVLSLVLLMTSRPKFRPNARLSFLLHTSRSWPQRRGGKSRSDEVHQPYAPLLINQKFAAALFVESKAEGIKGAKFTLIFGCSSFLRKDFAGGEFRLRFVDFRNFFALLRLGRATAVGIDASFPSIKKETIAVCGLICQKLRECPELKAIDVSFTAPPHTAAHQYRMFADGLPAVIRAAETTPRFLPLVCKSGRPLRKLTVGSHVNNAETNFSQIFATKAERLELNLEPIAGTLSGVIRHAPFKPNAHLKLLILHLRLASAAEEEDAWTTDLFPLQREVFRCLRSVGSSFRLVIEDDLTPYGQQSDLASLMRTITLNSRLLVEWLTAIGMDVQKIQMKLPVAFKKRSDHMAQIAAVCSESEWTYGRQKKTLTWRF
ncbi:hypothetical protein M3Y99_01824600 [Aphelenchoides fujianensis]|nr:hypothetical protein M3Y99_01824600 [Aphelenchoides fujianensis]